MKKATAQKAATYRLPETTTPENLEMKLMNNLGTILTFGDHILAAGYFYDPNGRSYQRHDPQTGRGGGEAVSLLSELKTVADACSIPVETGVFSGVPPDLYLVITPMADTFELHADNSPGYDTQEARLSLFVKGSYTATKDTLVRALLGADFCITDRRYIAHEDDTGFHHYAIDVAKTYEMESCK